MSTATADELRDRRPEVAARYAEAIEDAMRRRAFVDLDEAHAFGSVLGPDERDALALHANVAADAWASVLDGDATERETVEKTLEDLRAIAARKQQGFVTEEERAANRAKLQDAKRAPVRGFWSFFGEGLAEKGRELADTLSWSSGVTLILAALVLGLVLFLKLR